MPQCLEILLGDLDDRNIENVDFLLLDQIQKGVKRALVLVQAHMESIRRGCVGLQPACRKPCKRGWSTRRNGTVRFLVCRGVGLHRSEVRRGRAVHPAAEGIPRRASSACHFSTADCAESTVGPTQFSERFWRGIIPSPARLRLPSRQGPAPVRLRPLGTPRRGHGFLQYLSINHRVLTDHSCVARASTPRGVKRHSI